MGISFVLRIKHKTHYKSKSYISLLAETDEERNVWGYVLQQLDAISQNGMTISNKRLW